MSKSTPAVREIGSPPTTGEGAGRPILFIDGHCVLCQRAAGWVARHDRHGRVALAALQGATARRLLPAALREPMVPAREAGEEPAARRGAADSRGTLSRQHPRSPGSLVWRTGDGRLRTRSAALLAVAVALGGWYRAAALLWLVPRPLRDALYLAVARRRRRWFGATDSCLLPPPTPHGRVLD